MQKICSRNNLERANLLFMLLSVCSAAVFFCLLLYRFDNKYTRKGPQAEEGVLLLNEMQLADNAIFLVNGWEFYNGRLLAPEDFNNDPPAVNEYIFIGQYPGLEAGDASASPHGSATYRMCIFLPNEARTYMLELPEIYSSYRLYVNGKEAASLGNPEPNAYKPETGNRSVAFEAGGQLEILIAVSDFSHIYSGMVYPPAFGVQEAVMRMLSARLVFHGAICTVAVTIGLLALFMGLLNRKNRLTVIYGLACLCFTGYASYPVIHTMLSGFYPFYAIENISFCAMLAVVILLETEICGIKNRFYLPFVLFGGFMCGVSAFMPLLLQSGGLRIMTVYGGAVTLYKWLIAIYLTSTAIGAAIKKTVHSKALLCANMVFDCALIMDRLLPLYEPVITGWFLEMAGFFLIISIGMVIGLEVAAEYKKSAALEERATSMERLYKMQRIWYPMLQDRIEEAKAARHDLRHHFVMIGSLLEGGQFDKLKGYVAQYGAILQEHAPICYSKNDVVNILALHYTRLAQMNGIAITLVLDVEYETKISDADLCGLISNLLENAVEACLRQTGGEMFIKLSVTQKASSIYIFMENSAPDDMDGEFGFTSSKGSKRKGYGLDSVRAIARRYGGDAAFTFDKEALVFKSTVLLRG